jgi:GNAT superfamily N-acetyltransferase
MNIVHITDDSGRVVEPAWLKRAEGVHRQLRTALPADYEGKMRRVFAGGARMCIATDGDAVLGVAVYRISENTFEGLHLYVDDLVTDERQRSRGVGRALMEHLQGLARAADCEAYTLDSGTQRTQAHKFYFREEMVVTSFHFRKPLK